MAGIAAVASLDLVFDSALTVMDLCRSQQLVEAVASARPSELFDPIVARLATRQQEPMERLPEDCFLFFLLSL